jgi:hypothetical protein
MYQQERTSEETQPQRQTPDPKLSLALRFTAEDLIANRRGWLTDHQREMVNIRRRNAMLKFSAFAVLLAGVVLAWTLILNRLTTMDDLLLVAIFGALLVAISVLMSYTWHHFQWWQVLREDSKLETLLSISGRAIKSSDGTPQITVDDVIFYPEKKAFKAFKDDELYIIYYVPYSKTILAAHPVEV